MSTACDEAAGVWPDIEPDGKELHLVDFTRALSRFWQPGADFALNAAVLPTVPTGFQYKAQGSGRSGQREPIWPKALTGTVTEGSITWVCEAISTTSLQTTVSSVAWTADSPIAVGSQSLSGQIASALLDVTGAIDGEDYDVLVSATCADGQVIKKRCVLPVRTAKRVCCA
jgi:hypothetical protein